MRTARTELANHQSMRVSSFSSSDESGPRVSISART